VKRIDVILERLYQLECDLSMLAHSPEPIDSREMARNLADRVQAIREQRSTLRVADVDHVKREITFDVEPLEEP
jgi:hypothetical protein